MIRHYHTKEPRVPLTVRMPAPVHARIKERAKELNLSITAFLIRVMQLHDAELATEHACAAYQKAGAENAGKEELDRLDDLQNEACEFYEGLRDDLFPTGRKS